MSALPHFDLDLEPPPAADLDPKALALPPDIGNSQANPLPGTTGTSF